MMLRVFLTPWLQGLSASSFDYLSCSFHHGSVTGMDVCLRKPIIATCSMDKTIRVWNYENKSVFFLLLLQFLAQVFFNPFTENVYSWYLMLKIFSVHTHL